MKIEKINENSIALIMNSQDLIERNLKLSDLSYGSEKAQKLIIEVMQIADSEVGFKADGPIAIETVPLKEGDIKIIITKVFNPDELDARFSKFTPMKNDKLPVGIMQMIESTIDKFEEALRNSQVKGINEVGSNNKLEIRKEDENVCIISFDSIDGASDACKNVKFFDYESVLYKDEKNVVFYLVLSLKNNDNQDLLVNFNKVCNVLAEYGKRLQTGLSMNQAYYEEHYKIIIKEDAVNKLSRL